MKKIMLIFLLLITLSSSSFANDYEVEFSDSFSNLDSSNWTNYSSRWNTFNNYVTNSKADQNNTVRYSSYSYLRLKDDFSSYDQVKIRVDFRNVQNDVIGNLTDHLDAGIIIGNIEIYGEAHSDRIYYRYKHSNGRMKSKHQGVNYFQKGTGIFYLEFTKLSGNDYELDITTESNYIGYKTYHNVVNDLDVLDVNFNNSIYLYSKGNRWSAFDNISIEVVDNSILAAPSNLKLTQMGDKVTLSWVNESDYDNIKVDAFNFQNSTLGYFLDDESALSGKTILNASQDLQLNSNSNIKFDFDTTYFESFNDFSSSNNKKLKLMAQNGNADSDVVEVDFELYNQPQNFKYFETDSVYKFYFDFEDGTKYELRENGNLIHTEVNDGVITVNKDDISNISNAELYQVNRAYGYAYGYSVPATNAIEVEPPSMSDITVIQEGSDYVINWPAVIGATEYIVKWSSTVDGEYIGSASTLTNSINVKMLENDYGVMKYFKVYAKINNNPDYDQTTDSDPVGFKAVKSDLPEMGTFEATVTEDNYVLNWSEVDSAVGYLIEKQIADGEWIQVYVVASDVFTYTTPVPATDYGKEIRFRISALLDDTYGGQYTEHAYSDAMNIPKPVGVEVGTEDIKINNNSDSLYNATDGVFEPLYNDKIFINYFVDITDKIDIYNPLFKIKLNGNTNFDFEMPTLILKKDGVIIDYKSNFETISNSGSTQIIMSVVPDVIGSETAGNYQFVLQTNLSLVDNDRAADLMNNGDAFETWKIPYFIEEIDAPLRTMTTSIETMWDESEQERSGDYTNREENSGEEKELKIRLKKLENLDKYF